MTLVVPDVEAGPVTVPRGVGVILRTFLVGRPKSGWVLCRKLPPGWEGYGLEKVAETPAGTLYRNTE